ncbi:MAG TPA: ATP-binding protein [Blastocatellia bacterium]|nr:ATP-binding protein [Blastocatellia bacterium]
MAEPFDDSSTISVSDANERIEQARREAEQRASAEYERLLDRLASLAQAIGAARDLKTIYRALYDFTRASTPCHGISVFLVERGYRTAVYVGCDGKDVDLADVPSIEIRGSGPHTTALITNKIVILNDYHAAIEDGEFVPIGFEVNPVMPRSLLIAPMSVMGRVIGSFETQSPESGAFNQTHESSMRMAAALAAVAIENVRLFERERQSEGQLRQSQKMEAVGQLAGGIAHDFNNLLTAIIGYSQLVYEHLAADDPIRREVEEIQKAGERAASLTSQLLAFSRRQVLQPKVLDLNAIVSDMQSMLGRLIGEDIELITFFDPELGRVKADPVQIEQALMNLAGNARDAMPQGGKLVIQTANVRLDESHVGVRAASIKPGQYVMLSVTDTGCGMDKETLSHIFEPFYTTKEHGKGTGLGLSMVYGIVSQSGGDISVESEPGKGATFKIYLPQIETAAGELKAKQESAREVRLSETILLVEDEAVVRKLVREVLEMNGYNVLEAINGHEALAICQSHPGLIHLLLTDVVMPQMSGRELAERFNALRSETKVLYMSGYTDDAIVHRGVGGAKIAFIQKPFTPDSLAAKVREVLDQSRKHDAPDESDSAGANLSDEADLSDSEDSSESG